MADKYVPVFYDWIEATQELNDQEKGRLIDAVVLYARGGDWQERIKGNERYAFPVFRLQVDRAKDLSGLRAEARKNKADQNEQTATNGTKHNKTPNNNKYKNNNKNEEQIQEQEQEQEQDQDARAAMGTVEAYASSNLECLTPSHMAALGDFKRDLPDDVIRYAIDQACGNGAPRWSYVAAILQGFVEAGVKTLGDAKARSARHKKQAQKQRNPALNYEQRGDGVERVPMVWED